MTQSNKKIGLIPRLLLGIFFGIAAGALFPQLFVQLLVTISSIFSLVLKFSIPFIILSFVIAGIADLTQGAGKILGIATAIAYSSTIVAGLFAYLVATSLFPLLLQAESTSSVGDPESGMLSSLVSIPLAPMFDVTGAIVLAFIMGLGISYLKTSGQGETLYQAAKEFQIIIAKLLEKIIIPFLPIYIAGTFANITYAGQVFAILGLLWKVFCVVIPLHMVYLLIMFTAAGFIGKKNPFQLIKNQIPAYLTAVGTQSSAATIPVNVACAEKNGVSKQIREFVVPLCATIHLAGSVISLTCFITALFYMNQMEFSLTLFLPFLLILGVAMVAAPGAPGGAVMSALPFLPLIGVPVESTIATLLIALYMTQDSFGTAANVSGDNAIAVVIDSIHNKLRIP